MLGEGRGDTSVHDVLLTVENDGPHIREAAATVSWAAVRCPGLSPPIISRVGAVIFATSCGSKAGVFRGLSRVSVWATATRARTCQTGRNPAVLPQLVDVVDAVLHLVGQVQAPRRIAPDLARRVGVRVPEAVAPCERGERQPDLLRRRGPRVSIGRNVANMSRGSTLFVRAAAAWITSSSPKTRAVSCAYPPHPTWCSRAV